MKRLHLIIIAWLLAVAAGASNREVIYQGPKDIGDWGAVELSSVKFHGLELGDTVYVYARATAAEAKGAFQNHDWHELAPGVLNGQTISGDFELIVDTQELLDELKRHGLKVRGTGYTLQRIELRHRDDSLTWAVAVGSSVVAVLAIVAALLILLHKNRQLRRAYHSIYMVNLDYLAAADKERQLRTSYEGQIAAFKEMMQAANKKYQGSTLGDDDKAALVGRILQLFENSEEIYATDFDVQKLADLTDSSYRYVSQVVNEQLGKNFNQLLSEYRIQEARRRLNNNPRYGSYTIEAIGESVGFGSRSTFVTTFKKLTGLTPSEFQRQARSKWAERSES